ncbi:MAG: hypothetical protein IIY27_01415, partial [Aeriscardovia sp.]|nr:hypothetical protein [Aeriscardovia sp.]
SASTPEDAVTDLTSAQASVQQAITKARSAISSMKQAGYSQESIANANGDLSGAGAVQTALTDALKVAKDKAATEASYAKAMALTQSLSQTVSQMTAQLKNLDPIGEELNLDSKILSESLASSMSAASPAAPQGVLPASYVPSAGGMNSSSPTSPSAASNLQSSPSEPSPASSKRLAATGSSAEDIEIASAVLLAGGIAVEAVKKSRGRHARNR